MNIEGFDNLEQIGEGGMAVVWKAHQVSLERDVAIKILKAELSADPEEVADFTREAKAAASLKHPNIIQVYDAAEQEGVYYFVMEYIAGQTAEQVLENGPLHWKKVAQIGLAIAEALDYAWNKASLIHRDVKPSNIMFDDDGTIKLADLGLAKRLDTDSLAEQIQIRKLEGTPNYMSRTCTALALLCIIWLQESSHLKNTKQWKYLISTPRGTSQILGICYPLSPPAYAS